LRGPFSILAIPPEIYSLFDGQSSTIDRYFRVFFLGRFRQVMQSIFAAILPSPLVGAGTLITR
jgi:hypothetical protein